LSLQYPDSEIVWEINLKHTAAISIKSPYY
jgi:hypothetical protein